jgi:hypothetical protein
MGSLSFWDELHHFHGFAVRTEQATDCRADLNVLELAGTF